VPLDVERRPKTSKRKKAKKKPEASLLGEKLLPKANFNLGGGEKIIQRDEKKALHPRDPL